MKIIRRKRGNKSKVAKPADILRGRQLDAQAKIGFIHLISQEGGVVSAIIAAVLYGGRTSATGHAVRKATRDGQLIAVKDKRGSLLIPRWQFAKEGGALPGLRETMEVLRQHPHYHDLLPFTFFLNASARLGGRRPLDLLRSSKELDLRLVMILAMEAAE